MSCFDFGLHLSNRTEPIELPSPKNMAIHFPSLTLGNQSLLLTGSLSSCDALFSDEINSPDC